MYTSPSPLGSEVRERIAATLNERLLDGLDLHSHLKVAHWNVKGPGFAALHPLFETFGDALALHNDAIAERAVTLGALARGTSRQVAGSTSLPEYPVETVRDMEHVKALADRIDSWLKGLRSSRAVCDEHEDTDSADLLTGAITEFEKNAWFLRAHLV